MNKSVSSFNQYTVLTFVLFALSFRSEGQTVASKVYHWNDLKVEKTETRERRPVLNGPTTFLDKLEIHSSKVPAGKAPHASHSHEDEELIIVREGKLKVTIGDQSRILSAGSVALAISGEEHGFENGGDGDVVYYVLRYKSKAPLNVETAKKAGGSILMERNDLAIKENAKGARINYFERPTSITDRFEMHVTRLNAGQNSHTPHTHRAEEIILIMKGNVSMQIGDRHENASPGDLVFLGSEIPHALTNTGTEQCEYFAFQW